jgi:hypothetical protein
VNNHHQHHGDLNICSDVCGRTSNQNDVLEDQSDFVEDLQDSIWTAGTTQLVDQFLTFSENQFLFFFVFGEIEHF